MYIGSKLIYDIYVLLLKKNFIMPPTLKKLMGHIAFGASVSGCGSGCVTIFVPIVTLNR